MLVTDLAFQDMEARAQGVMERVTGWLTALFRSSRPGQDAESIPMLEAAPTGPLIHLVTTAQPRLYSIERPLQDDMKDYRWRKHPQLRPDANAFAGFDPAERERMARSASIRGLFLARSGRFEEARTAFAMAAAEASVDLTDIPGFWTLSRGGMQAAIDAYEDVERYREASSLAATIRLKYRPRVAGVPAPGVSRRKTASGS